MTPTRQTRWIVLLLLSGVGLGIASPRGPSGWASVELCRHPLGLVTALGERVECLPAAEVPLFELAALLAQRGAAEPCLLVDGAAVVRAGEQIRLGTTCELSFERLSGRARLVLGLPVEINRANVTELQLLPGIGPALARRLVAHRRRTGCFTSWRQLQDVRGIGPATVVRLRDVATINETPRGAPAPCETSGRGRKRCADVDCDGYLPGTKAEGRL